MCGPNQTTSPNEIQTRTDKTFEDTPAVCLPCGSGSANEFSLHCTLALAYSLNLTYVKCIKVFFASWQRLTQQWLFLVLYVSNLWASAGKSERDATIRLRCLQQARCALSRALFLCLSVALSGGHCRRFHFAWWPHTISVSERYARRLTTATTSASRHRQRQTTTATTTTMTTTSGMIGCSEGFVFVVLEAER